MAAPWGQHYAPGVLLLGSISEASLAGNAASALPNWLASKGPDLPRGELSSIGVPRHWTHQEASTSAPASQSLDFRVPALPKRRKHHHVHQGNPNYQQSPGSFHAFPPVGGIQVIARLPNHPVHVLSRRASRARHQVVQVLSTVQSNVLPKLLSLLTVQRTVFAALDAGLPSWLPGRRRDGEATAAAGGDISAASDGSGHHHHHHHHHRFSGLGRRFGPHGRDRDSHHRSEHMTVPVALTPAQQAAVHAEAGRVAERECRLDDAIAHFEAAVAADPTSAEYYARLSKQWSDKTYLDPFNTEAAITNNNKAIELGLQAVEVEPTSAFGHVALGVSRGRLAIYTADNKAKVMLATDAQADVRTALELEPQNDLAHHLMGRWHYEMASVNMFVRALVRMLYGASLMVGTYQGALECYQTAVALKSDSVIHHVELGRTFLQLGEKQKGVEELEVATQLLIEDVNAKLQAQTARELLAELATKR